MRIGNPRLITSPRGNCGGEAAPISPNHGATVSPCRNQVRLFAGISSHSEDHRAYSTRSGKQSEIARSSHPEGVRALYSMLLCCFINRRTLKIASRTLSDVVNRVRLGSHYTVRCSNSPLSRHHAWCHHAQCWLSKQGNAKQSNTTHGYTQAHVHRYR